jgi:TctA family transporter
MTDTLMTETWWAAHRRMDCVLKFFFIVDVFGTFIGVTYHDRWFSIVWIVAALSAGAIATSERESFVVVNTPEDDEFTNEKELTEAYVFARKLAKASNLLAATLLAVGFVIGNPWWSNLLVALSAWFVGLFGIPLLCASRSNRACDADRDPGGSVQIVAKGFAASDGDLATPTGFAL